MGLLIHNKKLKLIPNRNSFFWDTSSTWFPYRSLQLWIDITNQALMCSYVADPARSLCVHRKNGSSGMAAHPRSPTLHLSTLGFNVLTSILWIPLSPSAEEDFQWWKSAHNVLRGAPVTPTEPDTQLFTDASNIGWGAHWNAFTVSDVWTTTEITLHINVLKLEAIHRAMLYWLRKLMCLTVLVASENSTVVSYIKKQGGTGSIQL